MTLKLEGAPLTNTNNNTNNTITNKERSMLIETMDCIMWPLHPQETNTTAEQIIEARASVMSIMLEIGEDVNEDMSNTELYNKAFAIEA